MNQRSQHAKDNVSEPREGVLDDGSTQDEESCDQGDENHNVRRLKERWADFTVLRLKSQRNQSTDGQKHNGVFYDAYCDV